MRTVLLWIRICCLSWLIIIALPAPAQDTDTDIYLEIECVCTAEWNYDGSKLAVVAWPDIQIWNAVNWELDVTITEAYANSIAWHPYENSVATVRGGEAEGISVWDATTGERTHYFERLRQPEAPSVVMHALAWSPEGDRIITDSDGYDTLLMWDLNADDNPQVFVPRELPYFGALSLAWSPDGRFILSGGYEDTFPMGWIPVGYIWDAGNSHPPRAFRGSDPLDWGQNSQQFVSVGRDTDNFNVITIWDVESLEAIASFDGHSHNILFLSWNSNEGLIASADIEGDVIIWDIAHDTSFMIDGLPFTFLSSVDWHPHSTLLAIAGEGGVVIRNIIRPE